MTGHAGDGKSTIALEIYQNLSGIPANQPLPQPLKPREDISGTNISIFKDLSERRREDDTVMTQELLERKRRFLIVSNNGDENGMLYLYDVIGKTILGSNLTSQSTIELPNNLPQGAYIINFVTENNNSFSKKLIVK